MATKRCNVRKINFLWNRIPREPSLMVLWSQRFFVSRERAVTRLRRFAALSPLKKNLWDQGSLMAELPHVFYRSMVEYPNM